MWRALLLVVVLFACVQSVHAQSGEYEVDQIDPKAGTFTGRINGQMRTFRVRPSVETTINGLKGRFEEIEPGMKVKVTSAEPGVATRLAAAGLRTQPATTSTGTSIGSRQPARQVKVEVRAKEINGFPIGDVQKGTRISIQYLSGKWKNNGRIAHLNPISDDSKFEENDRLCISLPAQAGKAGEVLAIIPAGDPKRPFVYEADKDYAGIVLRINDDDGKFDANPGSTHWNVKIVPPR